MTAFDRDAGAHMEFRRHYLGMLGISTAIIVALLALSWESAIRNPYVQFLVDYDLGFLRRAFAGEIFSHFLPEVSQFSVGGVGAGAILLAGVLYLTLFRRDFGFTRASLPLLVFIIASPFFFKMFARHLGYFDIYGFILACVALLLPLRKAYPAIITLGAIALILTHHLHFLLYIPLIGFVCLLRYLAERRRLAAWERVYAAICMSGVGFAFMAVLLWGGAPVPREILLEHMQSRAIDGFDSNLVEIWYRSIFDEMRRTFARLDEQAVFLPLYLLTLLIHWPLFAALAGGLRALKEKSHRVIVYAGLAAICLGYFAIFVMIFDYNRWLSNWAVCMILALHAISRLPSSTPNPMHIAVDRRRNIYLGWLVALDFLGGPGTPGFPPGLL
ncbi:MAG: putative rane protein [Pseudomonadota bacterium]|jgi:hypothetical protein